MTVESKIDQARKELLQRQRLQTRLQDLFLTAETGSLYTKKLPGDKIESLIAVSDNGIDPDPPFSGKVVARVYLDENRNLSLALWPHDASKNKNRPWRNEILLTGVDSYEFLSLKKTEDKFAWGSLSPMNSNENPSMIRMNVRQNQNLLNYAFFFSSQEPLVTYYEGSAR